MTTLAPAVEVHVNGVHVATGLGSPEACFFLVMVGWVDSPRPTRSTEPPRELRLHVTAKGRDVPELGIDAPLGIGDVVELRIREVSGVPLPPRAPIRPPARPVGASLPAPGRSVALDVAVNGTPWCRAGQLGEWNGDAMLTWVENVKVHRPPELHVATFDGEFLRAWIDARMRVGDDIRIELTESDAFDPPVYARKGPPFPDARQRSALDPRLGSEGP